MSAAVSQIPQPENPSLAHKVVRAVVFLCALALVAALAYLLRFLLTPAVLALLIYYCLAPLVNLMENHGIPRAIAVAICFAIGIGAVVILGLALWPSLEHWLKQVPPKGQQSGFEVQLAARIRDWEAAGRAAYPKIDWHAVFDRVRAVLESQRRELMETLPTMAMAVLQNAGSFLLGPVIALFILIDGSAMMKALIAWVPNRHFETALVLLHRVDRQIAAYLRGAASESGIVAFLMSLALLLAGMPNALLLGCIYGVLNVIPIAGPVIGAGSGLLYALLEPNAPSMGVLLACYGVVYGLDAMLINPLVVGKNLNLHPLTVILGITVGGSLGGILGMLAIIPLIAISKAVAGTLVDAYRHHAII